MSNATLNNILFTGKTIPFMQQHPSVDRLYQAAKSKGVKPEPSAVAKWLNESPQVVNNWKERGVSRKGALAAQALSGYSATWILDGSGEPRQVDNSPPSEATDQQTPSVPPEFMGLLRDWMAIPPPKRAPLLESIVAAANAAREAHRYLGAIAEPEAAEYQAPEAHKARFAALRDGTQGPPQEKQRGKPGKRTA